MRSTDHRPNMIAEGATDSKDWRGDPQGKFRAHCEGERLELSSDEKNLEIDITSGASVLNGLQEQGTSGYGTCKWS